MKIFIELLGWYGAFAIVGAYFLNSFGKLSSQNLTYQLMNLSGAVGIVIVSAAKSAWQPAALNLVWAVISAVALVKIRKVI